MKTIAKKVTPALLAVALLGGCANDMGQKEGAGALLGGIGGAVAGAQFGKGSGQVAAAALGTLLGAYAGSEMGKSLDRADRLAAQQAATTAQTAPIGQTIRWNNPQSGNYGTYTPVRDGYDSSSGSYCREYQTTVTVGGKTENAYGTACRQPDGSWKVVK
ncbi:MAG: glycine zipper 2TM domain-containing protein [Rhodospirillales bacterium]|nr:glycine zipper 2TM domain-containing protein [Rhodospirillales bacterium]